MKFMFTHISLENWRNFRSVDLPLRERMFIVGANASGKTNFLDVFKFLGDIAKPKGSLAGAVESRGGFGRIRSLHAHGKDRHLKIVVDLLVGETKWKYELTLSGKSKQPAVVEHERVLKNGTEQMIDRPNAADKADPRLREQTHLEQLTQNARFRDLADALASVAHVHVVPQVAKGFLRSDEATLRDAPGSDFIERIAMLSAKKQRGALRRIEKLLKSAVPQFSSLNITHEKKTGRPHLEASYKHWRAHGTWQNEQEFSDGTLRLIGLLWAILEGDSPLLLEEPELSLHEAVVKQVPRILARAGSMRGRQIIVTTHSEKVLNDRGVDPSEIVLLEPTKEATEAKLASEDEAVVRGAKAKLPLGPLVSGRTKPSGIDQLILSITE